MSPNKTIYIRDDDVPTWEEAEKVAASAGQPLSQLVVRLLRNHLAEQVDPKELTVEMRDREGREWTEGFRGWWLIEPDDDQRFGPDAGACYGIAETAKGNIAVYVYHVNDRWPPVLSVHPDLDDAQHKLNLDPVAIAIAAEAAGQTRIVHRDI